MTAPTEWSDHSNSQPSLPSATHSVGIGITGDNNGTVIGTQFIEGVVPLESVPIDELHLRSVDQSFAQPHGFHDLVASPGGILVFDLPPGRGRSATAEALAAHLVLQDSPIVAAARLSFGGSEVFPVNRVPREPNRAWLLEVPADEDEFEVHASFGANLVNLSSQLSRLGSKLLVLARPKQWQRIGGVRQMLPHASELLSPVPSTEIALAQLSARPIAHPAQKWVEDGEIAELLVPCTPAEVLEIVDLIMESDQTGRDSFADRVTAVVNARRHWRRQLLDWHREPGRTAFHRNFHLAAATLRGLPVGHVYLAAVDLCDHLGDKPESDNAGGQTAPGVIEMAEQIHAELQDDDRLEFTRPGWDDAVLEYFWVDRPLSRKAFIRWLASAVKPGQSDALEGLGQAQRRAIADRLITFALRWADRQQRDLPIRELAVTWHGKDEWERLVEILTRVALSHRSDELGQHRDYVHGLLLTWAKTDTPALVHIVLKICASKFSTEYTSKALVRLKHAGKHTDSSAQKALTEVVAKLWEDVSARSGLVSEIAGWCADEKHRAVGCAAFRKIASSTTESPVRSLEVFHEVDGNALDHNALKDSWNVYLSYMDHAAYLELVTQWLDVAWANAEQRPLVIDMLRTAASAGTEEQNQYARDRLRTVSLKWREDDRSDARRSELDRELREALDADLLLRFQQARDGQGRDVP